MGSRQSLFQGGRFHLVFVSELCRDPWRKYDKAGQVAFADYSNICVSPGRWVSGIVERCWHTVVEKSPYLWFKVEKTLELFDSLDQGRNILALFPNLVFLVSFWFLLDLWKKTCSFILLSGLWTGCQICVWLSTWCHGQLNHCYPQNKTYTEVLGMNCWKRLYYKAV